MMAHKKPPQNELFRVPKDIGAYVASDHLLRRVAGQVDFDFAYHEVESKYGAVGHESTPPPVILKLMLLLTLYNVSSARELMRTLPYRIDWLWFVGYQLGEAVPDHSVLSKARKRWGADVFLRLFAQVLDACRKAELIGGTTVHTDSSVIDANASIDSLFRARGSAGVAAAMAERLDDGESEVEGQDQDPPRSHHQKSEQARYRSETDPDATGAKQGAERMRPRYKTHRVVDDVAGVITSTQVGPGHENEAERLAESLDAHAANTGVTATVVVADSKYGTVQNYELCEERAVTAYVPPYRPRRKPADPHFRDCDFRYDPATDTYTCPASKQLVKKARRPERHAWRYEAPAAACRTCPARGLCTTSKNGGRRLLRQDREDLIDAATAAVRTEQGRHLRKRRMWMMEGCFARSKRYGYKRARWRGLASLRIQDLLVATVVNLRILLRHTLGYAASNLRRAMLFCRSYSCAIARIVVPTAA